MSKSDKRRTIPYRRKKKTDYKKRLKILKSNQSRLVVRRMGRSIISQIIDYAPRGDKIVLAASSKDLERMGWRMGKKNIPTAYLVGYLIGTKANIKGIKKAVFDTGLFKSVKGSRIYATLKGAIDAGLEVPSSEDIMPPEDRLKGKHIVEYSKISKGKSNQFSKSNPEELPKQFEEIKNKIAQAKK